MQKETLTLANIAKDLRSIALHQDAIAFDRYGAVGGAFLLAAVCIGFLTQRLWLGLLVALLAIYPIARYVMEYKRTREAYHSAMESMVMRGDVSISIRELSHIAQETIYEPHSYGRYRHQTKEATFFYFQAGSRWRVPDTHRLYEWSQDYYISPQGLENISLVGDKFFFVSLQGYPDVSYVYPCKSFVLDSSLKIVE